MGDLARRDFNSTASYLGYEPNRVERRTFREIALRDELEHQAAINEGRQAATEVRITNAVAADAMKQHQALNELRNDLAGGDPAVALELLPFQRVAQRKALMRIDALFGPF